MNNFTPWSSRTTSEPTKKLQSVFEHLRGRFEGNGAGPWERVKIATHSKSGPWFIAGCKNERVRRIFEDDTIMGTTEKPPTRRLRIAYYRSFLSYRIPFAPEDKISYSETEGLRSFYIAYHNPSGLVVKFVKILLTRLEQAVTTVPKDAPKTVVFFAVDPNRRQPVLAKTLRYSETEDMTEFFEGTILEPGRRSLSLFRKDQAFKDSYVYWPNGRLRERVLLRMDKSKAVFRYDRQGRVLGQRETKETLGPSMAKSATADFIFSGIGAKKAARDLVAQIKFEEIPGLVVQYSAGAAATAAHVAEMHPAAISSLVEALYGWMTNQTSNREIKLRVRGKKMTVFRPDHFDREECLARLSEALPAQR
jgi:hypothetical protein